MFPPSPKKIALVLTNETGEKLGMTPTSPAPETEITKTSAPVETTETTETTETKPKKASVKAAASGKDSPLKKTGKVTDKASGGATAKPKKRKYNKAANPDPGITCRKIKFGEKGVALLSALKVEFPESTISDLVYRGLDLLLHKSDIAPVVHYNLLNAGDVIILRGLLGDAHSILKEFRRDVMVARGTPGMLKPLAKKAEDQLDTLADVIKRVTAHAGIRQLSMEETQLLGMLIEDLEYTRVLDTTAEDQKKRFSLGISILKPHLPQHHD